MVLVNTGINSLYQYKALIEKITVAKLMKKFPGFLYNANVHYGVHCSLYWARWKQWRRKMWIGLFWLSIGTSGDVLWTLQWIHILHKLLEICWQAERLSASLEELCLVSRVLVILRELYQRFPDRKLDDFIDQDNLFRCMVSFRDYITSDKDCVKNWGPGLGARGA